jgi:hemerythrin-like domain-containing protein
MSDIIDVIHSEHKIIMRILGRLEREIGRFEAGKRPNFDLLKDIAGYFQTHPDQCHHPREDILYDALADKVPAAAEMTGDLRAEHEVLARQADTFSQGLTSILMEVEISRPAFVAMARNFIARQKHHLANEEKILLPLARAELDADELAAILEKSRMETSGHGACEHMKRFAKLLASTGEQA